VDALALKGLEAVRITTPVVERFGDLFLEGLNRFWKAFCSVLKFSPSPVSASFSQEEEEERKVGLRAIDEEEEDVTDLHVEIFLWNTKSLPVFVSVGK